MTLDEWNRIKDSAAKSRAAGGISRDIVDDADLLSVNHFYGIFDRFFEQIVPESSQISSDINKIIKKKILEDFKGIKDVRDPISHPPEQDVAPYDALNVVFRALRIFKVFGLESSDSYARIENLQRDIAIRATQFGEGPSGSNAPLSTLPPREEVYDQFIGRTTELEELWKWFADDTLGRWVLVGEGGKGKSTIAYQFADMVRSASVTGISAVLWMSAKKRRYEGGYATDISAPDFFDLDSALDKILNDYGWPEATSKSIEAKRSQVKQLLSELPALLVVDDLDSIESENEDVVEFFTYDAPKTGTKILLTSRRLYFGMGRVSTIISGLPPEDAHDFLSSMAMRMNLDVGQLKRHFPRMVDVTEGSPLYMEDLLRLCRSLSADRAIERWKQNAGDVSRRYALEREIEKLTPTARSVLNACCLARVALTVAQLQRIVDKSEDELMDAIDQLVEAYLVPGSVLVDGEPTFRVGSNLAWLVRRQLSVSSENDTLRAAVENVVGGSSGRSRGMVDDHVRQIRALVSAGRVQEAIKTVERVASEPGFAGEPSFLSAAAFSYASVEPPRAADARLNWLRSAELGLRQPDAYVQWCLFEDGQSEWGRLLAAAEAGIENCKVDKYKLLQFAGYASTRIANMQSRAHDTFNARSSLDRADRYFRSALDSAARSDASAVFFTRIYRGMVLAAQERKDPKRMKSLLDEWIKKMPNDPSAATELKRFRERYPNQD